MGQPPFSERRHVGLNVTSYIVPGLRRAELVSLRTLGRLRANAKDVRWSAVPARDPSRRVKRGRRFACGVGQHGLCGRANSLHSLFLVVQFIEEENSALHLFRSAEKSERSVSDRCLCRKYCRRGCFPRGARTRPRKIQATFSAALGAGKGSRQLRAGSGLESVDPVPRGCLLLDCISVAKGSLGTAVHSFKSPVVQVLQ